MARKRVVSRTIKTFIYTVMAVNKETAEVFSDNFIVTGRPITNESKLEKLYNKANPSNKFIDLTGSATEKKAYSMPEEDFIKYAAMYEPYVSGDGVEE